MQARSLGVLGLLLLPAAALGADATFASHPPMRPLPTARSFPLASGPKLFVDPARGNDANAGSEAAPWKTLTHAVRRLKPGDTLYLRGGIYYEKVALSRSGTEQAPITISGYPGEQAILDGGLREFYEHPDKAWQPSPGGAEGEYISTASYQHLDDR